MIDVTILGTGGGMPMVNRYLSSVLLSYKGRKILLDCGEGTQVAMRKFKTGFKSIDIICISHFHGDHIFGLPGLLSTMGNSERTEPITIVGPLGLKKIVEGLLVSLNYLPFKINMVETNRKSLGLEFSKDKTNIYLLEDDNDFKGDIILRALELNHSTPCYGYSFSLKRQAKFIPEKAIENQVPKEIWKLLQKDEEVEFQGKTYLPSMVLGDKRKGIKLSFVTDTRPTKAIEDFIRDSDLFICEGTYGSDEDLDKARNNKHMTFSEAAKLALNGQVKELLLTHYSPSMENPKEYRENARKIFKETSLGYDGLFKTLSFE